ncbi:MAG: hypothetical protein ACUZ8E_06260 [Candidatus Anammoxibacter sp.]
MNIMRKPLPDIASGKWPYINSNYHKLYSSLYKISFSNRKTATFAYIYISWYY